MRPFALLSAAALCLSAFATGASVSAGTTPPPEDTQAMAENADQLTTRILDEGAAERLRGADGMTLQWISWGWRGPVEVMQNGGLITIKGGQDSALAPADAGDVGTGRVTIDGVVTEIGEDYILFDGDIIITDSPDIGRVCKRSGPMLFRVTQNRQYWRLHRDARSRGN